jgi:hypothetical protein
MVYDTQNDSLFIVHGLYTKRNKIHRTPKITSDELHYLAEERRESNGPNFKVNDDDHVNILHIMEGVRICMRSINLYVIYN